MTENFTTREKLDLRRVSFVIAAMILLISCIYIVNFYCRVKHQLIKEIRDEGIKIQHVIERDIKRARSLIDLIVPQIDSTDSKDKIDKILDTTLDVFIAHGNFNNIQPLRGYYLIDKNFKKISSYSSIKGDKTLGSKNTGFVRDIIENNPRDEWNEKIMFYLRKRKQGNDSLEIIYSISDPKSKEYLWSIVLSYDLALMIRRISSHKRSDHINFALIKDESEPLFASRYDAKNFIEETNLAIPKDLKDKIFYGGAYIRTLYLEMFRDGINYFKINIPSDNEYLTLITSMDSQHVADIFYHNVLDKVVEVVGISLFFIILLIIFLRRESTLRLKSQRAEIIAKNGSRAKGDFLRFVAHEMRTPLAYITNTIQIMIPQISDSLEKKQQKYLTGIKQASEIITGLIRDILDEQQILAGKFTIKPTETDMRALVENAVRINQMKFLGDKKCKIILNIEYEGHEQKILCDQKRMLQVLNNLISNAVQYSYEHGEVKVSMQKKDDNLVIAIQDKGIGISSEDLKRILSYQYTGISIENNTLGEETHCIGIYIVKQILDAHKADFKIESILYKGTKVIIKFPIIEDKALQSHA